MDNSNILIETENLLLKSITLDSKDDIFREFTPEITTYMFPKPPEKIEETIEFIENSVRENQSGDILQAVVLDKHSKAFLGCAGIHHLNSQHPALGIWIKRSVHGHGYGKEAVIALKKWADQNLSYEYVLYPVEKGNIPSKKIPEFLGGKIAREYDEINQSGIKLHLLEYRIYPDNQVTKDQFKKLYFQYATPDSGWTEDYWNSSFENEEGKRYFFEKPTSPKSTSMFVTTDKTDRRIYFLTEEAEESFFDFPGKE